MMHNKQEGFEENDPDSYEIVNLEPFMKLAPMESKIASKNKYKMTFKYPLTIFTHQQISQSPCYQIPYNLESTHPPIQNQTSLQHTSQLTQSPFDLQPFEPISYIQQRASQQFLTSSIKINDPAKSIDFFKPNLQKPSDVFPKRFVCVFNKFHENVFLKNDLTIIVKNILKFIKLEQLKSIEAGFNYQNDLRQEDETIKTPEKKSVETLKQKHNTIRQRRYQSETNLKSQDDKIHRKKIDISPFYLQKSMILNSQKNQKSKEVQFLSNFQSGNLHLVFKDKSIDNVYYLFLTNDINTHGFNQWFYFGFKYSGKQSKKLRFIIMNISKQFRYQEGMKLLSLKDKKWHRNTPFLVYKNKYSKYNGGNLISLDFEYQISLKSTNQPVFFSFIHPYTYSRTLRLLKQIRTKTYKSLVVSIDSLGKSELTNSIPVLKIQRSAEKRPGNIKKPIILILARQHAGQTPSSFICESLVRILLSQNRQWDALFYKYKFIIIPMANPDGVVHGNSRTNIKGYDINRLWQDNRVNNISTQSAQTQAINNYISMLLRQKNPIQYSIDLHSHSKQLGSFVYCCDNGQNSKLFNYFFSLKYPECRYDKCKANLTSDKKCTFRGQMYYRYGIKNSFTIQTSFYGYKRQDLDSIGEEIDNKLIPFQIQNYVNIAASILFALRQIQSTRVKAQERTKLSEIIQGIDSKIRLSEKNNKNKNNNDSDSDPENQYLQVKQRQQNGQNVQALPKKTNSQQGTTLDAQQGRTTNISKLSEKNRSLMGQNRQMQDISKIECRFIHSVDSKLKRKKVYSTKNQAIGTSFNQTPNQANENPMPKKYLSQFQKQSDFRKTLRRGYRMARSQSGFYQTHSSSMRQQKQQQKNFIVYPTQSDIKIGYDSIRLLRETLFNGKIKVKSIKQQNRTLKHLCKEKSFSEFEIKSKCGNVQSNTIFKNEYIQQPTKTLNEYLNIGRIEKVKKYY